MPVFEVQFQAKMFVKMEAQNAEEAAAMVNGFLEDACLGAGQGFRIDNFFPENQIRWFPTADDAETVRQLPDGVTAKEYAPSGEEKFRDFMFGVIDKANNDPEFMAKLIASGEKERIVGSEKNEPE